MPRKPTPPAAPTLTSWDKVDQALSEIAVLEPQVATLQGRLDTAMARLKQRYEEKIDPLQEELKLTVKAVGDFVLSHQKDLSEDGDRRCRDLDHGRVGCYRSPKRLEKVGSKITWAEIATRLSALPKALKDRFLRVKEEPDKDALRDAIDSGEIDTEQARSFALTIAQDDIAYYELRIGR